MAVDTWPTVKLYILTFGFAVRFSLHGFRSDDVRCFPLAGLSEEQEQKEENFILYSLLPFFFKKEQQQNMHMHKIKIEKREK